MQTQLQFNDENTLPDILLDCLHDQKSFSEIQKIIQKASKKDKNLLSQGGLNVTLPNYTALMIAVLYSRVDIVEKLLKVGAPVNDLAAHYRYNYAISALDLSLDKFCQKKSMENNTILNLLLDSGAKKSDQLIPKGQTVTLFGTYCNSKFDYQQQRKSQTDYLKGWPN